MKNVSAQVEVVMADDTMLDAGESLNESILDEDCACEYGHEGVAPCSLTVTHRVHGCTPDSFNVCRAAVAVIRDRLPRDQCVDCGHLAGECWHLIPA